MFANFNFDNTAARGRSPDGTCIVPLQYDGLAYRLAKDYLPELKGDLMNIYAEKAVRLADEYYQNMKYCAETFSLEDNEPLSEEECFLSMVGTPTRSPRRHQQSMRMTFFVTNFLNNMREELSKFDDTLEDLEDAQYALGLALAVEKLSRADFEEEIFGCYSLNLMAFEAVVNNIERLEELIELHFPTEPKLLPHQQLRTTATGETSAVAADELETKVEVEAKAEGNAENDDDDDDEVGVQYVLADEGSGEFD